MKFTLPRSELKEAAQGFSKVVNGRSSIPVLGCARFSAGDQGVVAQVTDLDQVVEYRFDGAQLDGDGACIIPLANLRDLVKTSNGEPVGIEADSPLNIALVNHVGNHAVRQPVAGMDLDEWPPMMTDILTKPAHGFVPTYRRLTRFSSTDETRYLLNSVFIEVGKGENPVTMVATDGKRLASWNSMSLPLKKSIVLPVTKFLTWSRLPDEVEIGVVDDSGHAWLKMKAGPFAYTVKAVDGTYPNFRQVIPAEPGAHVITFTDSDMDLLKQVLPTFPGDEEITVVGQDGKVTLYGRGPDEEKWTTLTLESTTCKGDRTFIGLNRSYLLDALAGGFREFAITDELCPVLSRDANGGTHVLMPMRVLDPVDVAEVAAVSKPEAEAQDKDIPVDGAGDTGTPPEAKPETKPEVKVKPRKRRKEGSSTMPKNSEKTTESKQPTQLDLALEACEIVKTKIREANGAITDVIKAIREASREGKGQVREVEAARAALSKLQSISL